MIDNFIYSFDLVKTNVMVWLVPILFFLLLFIGSKYSKKGEWNEEYLSLDQTKALRGFCAIGILLHHISQKNAASWINPNFIIHGLDFFVDIGYLFVGFFIFISGYGLYKSYKNKENYFKHYILRRIVPVILAYLFTTLAYYLYNPYVKSNYTWYVSAILWCYLLFYIAYRFIKNENVSLIIIIAGIFGYIVYCHTHGYGGWWYNTISLFTLGIIFARFEKCIINVTKKLYWPLLLLTIVLTIVCRYYGLHFEQMMYAEYNKYDFYNTLVIVFRFIASLFFTYILVLTSLKWKFHNIILSFFDSISLELYLIQGLFVNMFAYCYFEEMIKPFYYIKSVPLYMLTVMALSIISGVIISIIDRTIMKLLNKIIVK